MKLKLSELKPNPDNPRFIKDDKFKKLVQSLKDFPEMAEVREIVVNKDHMILGGNMRYKAAKEAGWTEVPVKVVDWPAAKQKEFIIKDNVSGGEWDWDIIANEWDSDLLDEWGVDLPGGFGDEEVVEDEPPPVADVAVSKLGEIYQLGRHRLMCGDSTDFGQVSDLMDGAEADMVFTDPPYGIEIVGKNGKIGADNLATNQTYSNIIADETTEAAKKHYELVIQLGVERIVLFGGNYFADWLPFSPSWLIWDKRLDMNSNNFADGEMAWTNIKTRVRIYKHLWNGMIRAGDDGKKEHPTQKPVKLIADILKDFSKAKDLILDGFGGSGSTLIACEQLDRTCYMMELDPKYCDVIRKRYAKFIGEDERWVEETPKVNS